MDNKIKGICTCPHCGKKLNDYFRGNFKGAYVNKELKRMTKRYFCTEECYKDYAKDFIVEVYNGYPIFCIKMDEHEPKRYMPYFEANYYFINIDDCKKRMDTKGIAIIDEYLFSLMWQ